MKEINIRYLFLFLVVAPVIVWGIYRRTLLNDSVIYSIAKYYGSTSGGRQGGSDYYLYHYNGKYYKEGIKILRSKIHLYYFCKFNPSNPKICEILYDIQVPYCLTLDNSPKEGWDKLPDIHCPDDKPPLFHGRIELD